MTSATFEAFCGLEEMNGSTERMGTDVSPTLQSRIRTDHEIAAMNITNSIQSLTALFQITNSPAFTRH